MKDNVIKTETKTEVFKCKGCGNNLEFDPNSQMLKCFHCGRVEDFSKSSNVEELDVLSAFNSTEEWGDEATAYRCENCCAVVVLNKGQTATRCPYCNTSHVVLTDEIKGLKPNSVYPFTVDKKVAIEKSKAWAKSRFFAPRKFKKNLNEENFTGVYQPAFTFDSNTYSTYVGRIGNRHTRTVGSGKNKRVETYIVWRSISGTHENFFDDVLINADDSYSQKTLDKISPYDYSTIKVYDTEYLSGFMAKRSNREIEDCWVDAKRVIGGKIRRQILSKYSYDVVDYLNVNTTHENVTYKYALLPIYLLNYKYGKKLYSVHVNGNTGKVAGKTPISWLKVLLTSLLGVLVGALLFYLIYSNG